MNEKNLMQKIFEASNIINNRTRSVIGNYIIVGSKWLNYDTKSRINKIKFILNKING